MKVCVNRIMPTKCIVLLVYWKLRYDITNSFLSKRLNRQIYGNKLHLFVLLLIANIEWNVLVQ